MTYDNDNIFAKILRGEIPSEKLYEDDDTYAFMDIMPRAEGHCLVIPKGPAINMLDATPQQLAACIKTVHILGHAVMRGLGAGGVKVEQYSEAVSGQEVFHLHYHVLPFYEGQRMENPGAMADFDHLKAQADKIRAAL